MSANVLLTELYCSVLPSVREQPLPLMPTRLYAYVYKVSGGQQLRLCLLTILVFPLTLAPLELQRRIVDDAIAGSELGLLAMLGGLYLAILFVHGGMKYLRNIYQNRIAEGVTRLLRLRITHADAFGAEADEGTKQSIVASEAERVGGFVGESIAFPLLQGGIVLSVAAYMLVIEPIVATVALGFFIPSLLVVGFSQPILNRLAETKTTTVRELGECLIGKERGDAAAYAALDGLIERIYRLRLRISTVKYAIKFLNNLFGQLGPLSVLTVGGWLAIRGETEVGTIVAFISGYERMINPARDLLNFYRRLSIMRVHYGLVREAGQSADAGGR